MMLEFLTDNILFGILINFAVYAAATVLYRKSGISLLNPFLLSFLTICAILLVSRIPLENYLKGAAYLEFFLPVTILLLAIPLYRQKEALKAHKLAILAGVTSGVVTCILSTILLCWLFGLDRLLLLSLIPRSITTPLGLLMSKELGGVTGITTLAIFVNGFSGILFHSLIYTLFRIRHPVAKGIAMGTTSHAIGTAKALELGETIGAMSGLAIVLAGLITLSFLPLLNLLS